MGKLAEVKTKQTESSAEDFINGVADERKRNDSFAVVKMMKKATGDEPKMWGASIIGFGKLRYKSPRTDREVDWFKVGFSPRKANLTIYLMGVQKHAALLEKLGKHKAGGGCLYINKLDDVDLKILEKMIYETVKGK